VAVSDNSEWVHRFGFARQITNSFDTQHCDNALECKLLAKGLSAGMQQAIVEQREVVHPGGVCVCVCVCVCACACVRVCMWMSMVFARM
jgi:hypothetical protein